MYVSIITNNGCRQGRHAHAHSGARVVGRDVDRGWVGVASEWNFLSFLFFSFFFSQSLFSLCVIFFFFSPPNLLLFFFFFRSFLFFSFFLFFLFSFFFFSDSNRGFRCSETRHLFSSFGSGSKERWGRENVVTQRLHSQKTISWR